MQLRNSLDAPISASYHLHNTIDLTNIIFVIDIPMFPTVLYLLVCDDVAINPSRLQEVDILGITGRIRSVQTPSFPVIHPELVVFLMYTGFVGTGIMSLQVADSSGRLLFGTPPRAVNILGNPGDINAVTFRAMNGTFPAAGLYWVQAVFSGRVIASQPLWVVA